MNFYNEDHHVATAADAASSPPSSSFVALLDILDAAEDIMDIGREKNIIDNSAVEGLEPTPLGPEGVQNLIDYDEEATLLFGVHQMICTSSSSYGGLLQQNDADVLRLALRPLLNEDEIGDDNDDKIRRQTCSSNATNNNSSNNKTKNHSSQGVIFADTTMKEDISSCCSRGLPPSNTMKRASPTMSTSTMPMQSPEYLMLAPSRKKQRTTPCTRRPVNIVDRSCLYYQEAASTTSSSSSAPTSTTSNTTSHDKSSQPQHRTNSDDCLFKIVNNSNINNQGQHDLHHDGADHHHHHYQQEERSIMVVEEGRFRSYQSDQWNQRLQELRAFQQEHGHCLVPHDYPENPQLSQWIKRQRYQYKQKNLKRLHSTLTDKRQAILEDMGFVWDSHQAGWMEKFKCLMAFKEREGHCNVPSHSADHSLAVWVKSQRRQCKLYQRGARSTMTAERYEKLLLLGFDFNPRNIM